MTGTVLASLAGVAFFFAWMAAARVGFGAAALPPRARAVLAGGVGLVFPLIAYVAVRFLDEAPILQPLAAYSQAHSGPALLVTLSAAGLGFALFMGGILHLLFTSGPSESFTLRELAAALRGGRWLRSRRWRRRW